MNNKRQHERVDIALPVILVHEGREIAAQSRNLSAGGMLIDGATDIPFGATAMLRASLPPHGEDLAVSVTVRWIRDGAIGVQFGSLRAKETWAIHQLLKMLADVKPA